LRKAAENVACEQFGNVGAQKKASYLHRTAQPFTLAAFRPWGSSTGAGRIRLAGCKGKGFVD